MRFFLIFLYFVFIYNVTFGRFFIKANFDLKHAAISVIDFTGRIIDIRSSIEKYSAEIQMKYIVPGIYILEITDGLRLYKCKILIDN